MASETDKTLTLDQTEKHEQSFTSNENQKIFTTQKHLLTMLFIQWFLCNVILGAGIHSVFYDNATDYKHEIQSLIPIIVMTFYYAFGLSVAYTQYRVGLIIFASIGMVLFVVVSLIFSYLILAITALGVGFGATNQSYELITLIIIIFAVMATIAILTLKLSFELAKFIKTYTYSQV